jgi:hypothetical protein
MKIDCIIEILTLLLGFVLGGTSGLELGGVLTGRYTSKIEAFLLRLVHEHHPSFSRTPEGIVRAPWLQ